MRQLGRVTLGGDTDALAIDNDVVAVDADIAPEGAMHRITLQQPGVRRGIGEIVDRHDHDILPARFENGAQHVTADTSEPVDGDLDGHDDIPFLLSCLRLPAARRSICNKMTNRKSPLGDKPVANTRGHLRSGQPEAGINFGNRR